MGGNRCLVITQQDRYGYVIGTQGTRTTVNNAAKGDVLTKTAPLDHVEGTGQGETLSPASLYQDQLSKRVAPTGIFQKEIPVKENAIPGLRYKLDGKIVLE